MIDSLTAKLVFIGNCSFLLHSVGFYKHLGRQLDFSNQD